MLTIAVQLGSAGSVTGVDVAPDMIAVARVTAAPATPEIEWHVSDAADLPMATDDYDVVLCQMGLMFMEDRPAAIAEMHRVLAPGGRLVVNTPGAVQPPFELMRQTIADNISPELGGFVQAVFSMPDPDDVAALLADAGLENPVLLDGGRPTAHRWAPWPASVGKGTFDPGQPSMA
jgi:ubiquinone/menaquinone biosynthesis C-methylase UbiE